MSEYPDYVVAVWAGSTNLLCQLESGLWHWHDPLAEWDTRFAWSSGRLTGDPSTEQALSRPPIYVRGARVNTTDAHDCGQSKCRVIHTMLGRVAAGEAIEAVERDYDLCAGTLESLRASGAKQEAKPETQPIPPAVLKSLTAGTDGEVPQKAWRDKYGEYFVELTQRDGSTAWRWIDTNGIFGGVVLALDAFMTAEAFGCRDLPRAEYIAQTPPDWTREKKPEPQVAPEVVQAPDFPPEVARAWRDSTDSSDWLCQNADGKFDIWWAGKSQFFWKTMDDWDASWPDLARCQPDYVRAEKPVPEGACPEVAVSPKPEFKAAERPASKASRADAPAASMTVREEMAVRIFAAMVSGRGKYEELRHDDRVFAIEQADALIAELEKQP